MSGSYLIDDGKNGFFGKGFPDEMVRTVVKGHFLVVAGVIGGHHHDIHIRNGFELLDILNSKTIG